MSHFFLQPNEISATLKYVHSSNPGLKISRGSDVTVTHGESVGAVEGGGLVVDLLHHPVVDDLLNHRVCRVDQLEGGDVDAVVTVVTQV